MISKVIISLLFYLY